GPGLVAEGGLREVLSLREQELPLAEQVEGVEHRLLRAIARVVKEVEGGGALARAAGRRVDRLREGAPGGLLDQRDEVDAQDLERRVASELALAAAERGLGVDELDVRSVRSGGELGAEVDASRHAGLRAQRDLGDTERSQRHRVVESEVRREVEAHEIAPRVGVLVRGLR